MFWQNSARRSLWREMDRLQREMNRILDGATQRATDEFPPLNVWANEEHALITAEVPGIDVDDVEISVVGDTLTLSGERPVHEVGNGVQFHRRERWHGTFSRTLQLPFRIDADGVEANYVNGVLQMTLPRAEEDRPRQISVNVAS
jgi:HSP20 family protein